MRLTRWLYPGARVWCWEPWHRRVATKGTITEIIDGNMVRVHWDGEERPESVETPVDVLKILPESTTEEYHRYRRKARRVREGGTLALAGAALIVAFELGYRAGRMRR